MENFDKERQRTEEVRAESQRDRQRTAEAGSTDNLEEVLHEARVKEAVAKMPKDSEIELMGARFKCLSEPSRLKILFALSGGELCVDHIVGVVGGTQSAISHQLKTLKDNRIIKCRRVGKKMLYSVADSHIMIMAEVAKEHLSCDE